MKLNKLLRCWEAIVIGQMVGMFVCYLGGWPALGCSVSALVAGGCAAYFVKEADHAE